MGEGGGILLHLKKYHARGKFVMIINGEKSQILSIFNKIKYSREKKAI